VDSLVAVFNPKGIYERSDVSVRRIEELEQKSGLLYGDVPDKVKIVENGYKFYVDIKTGQKTGFFLDQRDKRAAIQKYCEGKKVLNCFSYTGGFSVYALSAGAEKVVSVDTSQSALDLAEKNVKLNKLDSDLCEFVCEDVKFYLQNISPGDFDIIILDPPAFIKDRRKKEEGIAGYKKINEMALRSLQPGSILVTCSCSAHLSLPDFRYLLSESAGRAGKTVQIIETHTHGIDHPELVAYTEGEYLKCFILRVV
jgi:23S rRNA (cytosine1962-C5)-methyltransferase